MISPKGCMYKVKSNGPSTEPCSTPYWTCSKCSVSTKFELHCTFFFPFWFHTHCPLTIDTQLHVHFLAKFVTIVSVIFCFYIVEVPFCLFWVQKWKCFQTKSVHEQHNMVVCCSWMNPCFWIKQLSQGLLIKIGSHHLLMQQCNLQKGSLKYGHH